MSFIKNLFGKKSKKDEAIKPEIFNGLLEFKHEGIIGKSFGSETPLNGHKASDTLFIESNSQVDQIGFVFSGSFGSKILSEIEERTKDVSSLSVVIQRKKDNNTFQSGVPSIKVPEKTTEETTFYQGMKWFDNNQDSIIKTIDKTFKDLSMVFLFVENNAFLIGVINKITEYLAEKGIQPVLVLKLPFRTEQIIDEFSVLTYIYHLMHEDTVFNIPFILLDLEDFKRLNALKNLSELSDLIIARVSNIILDLSIIAHSTSTFYQFDLSNFVYLFQNVKGPCKLLSFDIYDEKSDIAALLKDSKNAHSFRSKRFSSKGFIGVQLGENGLQTSNYKKIRKLYANKDTDFSILPKRLHGGVIRGIFTLNEIPETVLKRFQVFEELTLEVLDSSYNPVEIFDFEDLSAIWQKEFYRINVLTEE